MRHAKSDWIKQHCADFERPLTKRGQKAAIQMGKWLKQQQFHLDRIICSPAARTQQTSRLVLKELSIPQSQVIWEPAIYEASLDTLISIIDHYCLNARALLIIGHNPGLEQLLCHLSKDPPLINENGKLLTTAAIAVLEYDHVPITTKSHQAHLSYLIRPKELGKHWSPIR